jgi:hypothetical protein
MESLPVIFGAQIRIWRKPFGLFGGQSSWLCVFHLTMEEYGPEREENVYSEHSPM